MPRLPLTTERLALFGTLLATFGELHPLCDHWIQGSTSASLKRLYGDHLVYWDGIPVDQDPSREESGEPVWGASILGRHHATRHIASYTAVQVAATIGITRAFGYRVTPGALLAGAAINASKPRRAKALRFEVDGRVVYAKIVRHPGTAANNFMAEALRLGR